MSEYLRHLVNCTNRIEGACREIRECASNLAVENSNSTQQLKAEIADLAERAVSIARSYGDSSPAVDDIIRELRQLSAV